MIKLAQDSQKLTLHPHILGQILTSQPAVITNPAVLNQLQAMALQQSNLPIGHSPAIINQPVFIRAAGPIQAHPSVLASK